MGCATWRELLSARLDGEESAADPTALDAHLAGYPDCTAWAARVRSVHRAARISPVDPVPDLTDTILAAAAADRGAHGLKRPSWNTILVLRWVLVVLAALEIGMAAPEFTGRWHAGGELGTWAVASAVGLLSVAAKPARAGAMLPMLAVASVVTLVVTARDVAAGRALASAELPHLLLVAGVLAIAAIWWRGRQGDLPGPEVHVAPAGASARERIGKAGRQAA